MEKYCLCLHTLIPVRSNPSETAEMTTQLLFGELYRVEERMGKWLSIVTHFDSYKGWIDAKLMNEIDSEDYEKIAQSNAFTVAKAISQLQNLSKNTFLPVVAGSSLPFLDAKGFFHIKDLKFKYNDSFDSIKTNGNGVIELARTFINAPYLWGGRTLLGMDCSGLSQLVYKILGIALPRDASQQINVGKSVSFIAEAQPGDLAFFDNDEGQIIHVGILMNTHEIIHASGWVKVDKIDHQGIYNADKNTYTHKLRVIKRVLE